jgi:hypothetical protein
MTAVTLTKLWINRVDTGEAIAAQTGRGSRTQAFTRQVEVRTYASGRQRAISVAGEQGTIGFTLLMLDRATKDKLRDWAGVAVQVRDWRGQKWFGVFAGVEVIELAPSTLYSATITLMTTSYTEGA